jgi:hypothetical protein
MLSPPSGFGDEARTRLPDGRTVRLLYAALGAHKKHTKALDFNHDCDKGLKLILKKNLESYFLQLTSTGII